MKHWWIAAISPIKRPRTSETDLLKERSAGLGAHNKSLKIEEISGEPVSFESKSEVLTAEKLLGGLLKFLKESDNFKLLSECRGIDDLLIKGNEITICADQSVLDGLTLDESNRQTITEHFKQRGFDVKFGEGSNDNHDLNELKALLGEKLVVK